MPSGVPIPEPLQALLRQAYPAFFDIPREPIEVAAQLSLLLKGNKNAPGFDTHIDHSRKEVRVTLTWTGAADCVFVASAPEVSSAIFATTLAAMNDRRTAVFFDQFEDGAD
jgi:hypothetical protein